MKKPLKVAGICGIIILAVGLFVGIMSLVISMKAVSQYNYLDSSEDSFLESTQDQFKPVYLAVALSSLVLLPFGILFLNGFLTLGKRFKNKFLITLSWIFIIFSIVSSLMMLISIFTGDIYPDFTNDDYSENSSILGTFLDSLKNGVRESPVYAPVFYIVGDSNILFWIFFISVTALTYVFYILFGVGILQLSRSKVPMAVPLGIFAVLTPFGGLFSFVFSILAIIMFFKVSRIFEEGVSKKPENKKKSLRVN